MQPGGRIAFTDWVVRGALSEADRDPLLRDMAIADLCALQGYGDSMREAGFTVVSIEDLTAEWAVILAERLAMFRRLRQEAQAAGTPPGDAGFYESYVRFVDLVGDGILGGGRFVGRK